MNLFISFIFEGPNHIPFNFTWDRFDRHGPTFSSEYNYVDAQFLLQLSLMVTESSYLSIPLTPSSKMRDVQLLYDECPLAFLSQGVPNVQANQPTMIAHVFYNENDNLLFIIFTGTINGCMAALDMAYDHTEAEGILNYVPGLRVHRGIYLAYNSIRSKLVNLIKPILAKNAQLIISGHSLGGAISQLCTLDLAYYNPIHYSFAAPMIFNEIGYKTFTNLVNNSYRIANLSDLIVLAPLPIMPNGDTFFHVGKLVHFQRNLGEYSPNHTNAYIQEYDL